MQEAGPTPFVYAARSPVTMPDRLRFQAAPLVPIQTRLTRSEGYALISLAPWLISNIIDPASRFSGVENSTANNGQAQ
jgi:hypothetical protein